MLRAAQEKKADQLVKIKNEINASSIVLFADFRGLTVGQITNLRRRLKKEGGRLSVYKNTLTRRALDELSIKYSQAFLIGPSAVIHTEGDVVKVSKVLVDFKKEIDKLTIKGGLLDNNVLDSEGIKALAALPGREELLAKLVGTLKSPLNKLVGSLSSPLRGLVYAIAAIEEKKKSN